MTLMVAFTYVNAQEVSFEEFDLDNGLHVIMHQDNTAPVITVGAMHDVGGKDLGGDNNPERTGFAHFFEHLLASGPTKNIEKGQVFLSTRIVVWISCPINRSESFAYVS